MEMSAIKVFARQVTTALREQHGLLFVQLVLTISTMVKLVLKVVSAASMDTTAPQLSQESCVMQELFVLLVRTTKTLSLMFLLLNHKSAFTL